MRWSCAPSCNATVMVPPLLQQPLFQCHFFLSWAFFLDVPPLVMASAIPPLLPPPPCLLLPLLLCLLPLSGLPLLLNLLDICRYVPQLKFRKTISGNFYPSHSSALLRTHCQIISSSVFVKKKILN